MDNMTFLSPALIITVLILLTLAVYWIVNFIILYHLIRFGIGTQPKKIAALFLCGLIVLFFLSVLFFSSIDAGQTTSQLTKLVQQIFNKNYLQ